MTRLAWKTVPHGRIGHLASGRGLYRAGETIEAKNPGGNAGAHTSWLFAFSTLDGALHRASTLYRSDPAAVSIFELSYDGDSGTHRDVGDRWGEVWFPRCKVERQLEPTPCPCDWCQSLARWTRGLKRNAVVG